MKRGKRMRTLILNGSPRKNGDTAVLVEAFCQELEGEVRMLTPDDGILPCSDCRRCKVLPGCSIQDKMQDIYPYLTECDNVVLASPVWFSSLSGPLLTMASRMQTLFCARFFRRENLPGPEKNGVLLLVGAQPETAENAARSARTILRTMGARRPLLREVYSMDTDRLPARQDAKALGEAREAAALLNRLHEEKQKKEN